MAGSSARKLIVSDVGATFRLGRSDVAGQMNRAGTAYPSRTSTHRFAWLPTARTFGQLQVPGALRRLATWTPSLGTGPHKGEHAPTSGNQPSCSCGVQAHRLAQPPEVGGTRRAVARILGGGQGRDQQCGQKP